MKINGYYFLLPARVFQSVLNGFPFFVYYVNRFDVFSRCEKFNFASKLVRPLSSNKITNVPIFFFMTKEKN